MQESMIGVVQPEEIEFDDQQDQDSALESEYHPFPLPFNRFSAFQKHDPDIGPLFTFLESGQLPSDPELAASVSEQAQHYVLADDCVCFVSSSIRLLLVPKLLRTEILRAYHVCSSGAHFGVAKTFGRLRLRFIWPRMFQDVSEFISSCFDCQSSKNNNLKSKQGLLHPIEVPHPWDLVAVDVLGPLPVTKASNKYVVVFMDYFTRYCMAFAVPDMKATTIASLLVNHVVAYHGCPVRLLSDQGSNFLSTLVAEVCSILSIRKIQTTGYHPQTDGLVERANRTLLSMLRIYVNSDQDNWDQFVPLFCLAYNSSPHEVTKYSPFFPLHGFEPRLPPDAHLEQQLRRISRSRHTSVTQYTAHLLRTLDESRRLARARTAQYKLKQKDRYDSDHIAIEFDVGDQVLLWREEQGSKSQKLVRKWDGPYRVVDKISSLTYRVNRVQPLGSPTDVVIAHVQRLKPYTGPASLPPLPEEADEVRVKSIPESVRNFYGLSTRDGRISKEGGNVTKS
jgi:hypothetical protein